jgi:hypothetical protein
MGYPAASNFVRFPHSAALGLEQLVGQFQLYRAEATGGDGMPMKNPAHPGELIRDNIDESGLSIRAAAKGLGVTRQQLHNIITRRSAVKWLYGLRRQSAASPTPGCACR